ncbi:hypothetical protein EYF80_033971 [Liparis tanakae]|uniref:Uncharacterized protein n=1 Tax=Liparis tanakae TaxID=230148 RepID=A0A4Z2GQZ1_9TELE|nr:hypothetical protein EYF80_033971 [Liparis tanakae]
MKSLMDWYSLTKRLLWVGLVLCCLLTQPLHAGPEPVLQVHDSTVELLVVQTSQLFLKRSQQRHHTGHLLLELSDQQRVLLVGLQDQDKRTCLSCLVLASLEQTDCCGATTVQTHRPSGSWAELYTCQPCSGAEGPTWRETEDTQAISAFKH